MLRTPVLKVKKAPPSLVPHTKETLEQQAAMSSAVFEATKQLRNGAKTTNHTAMGEHQHAHTVKPTSTKKHLLSSGQSNAKPAGKAAKSGVAKIKELIEQEEGLLEISKKH